MMEMGDIIDRYHQQICDMYMATHPHVNRDQVMSIIVDITQKHFTDIPCKLHNNIKHEMIDTTVKNTFDWLETKKPIISGAGSFFKQHSEYLSPSTIMLESLMDDRGSVKKEMLSVEKGSIEYMNLNTEQSSIKVIMNADYGGSGTPLSPFYSQYIPPATTGSAKNITTTLICCLEYSSDNKHKYAKHNTINELYDMIRIVLSDDTNRELIYDDSFTSDDVLQRLCSKTNNMSMNDVRVLKAFLTSLDQCSLTKLMLAFNVRLVLTKYLSKEVSICADYFKSHSLDTSNITKETLYDAGYGKKAPEVLIPYIERINKVVLDNCIYPFILNDAETRAANMVRDVVCVTDTDSLMVHFASYINEFQSKSDKHSHVETCLFASALGVRLFVEGIIPRFTEYVAEGCRIEDKYYRDKFIFKNEFGFLAQVLINKKMYASSMFVQEGAPRDIHDIAVSGLSFKKRDAAEFLEPIMVDLYDKCILTNGDVDVKALIDTYYYWREKLFKEVKLYTKYYQVLGVKSAEAYDPNKKLPDQVRGSDAWNALFVDDMILPQDRVIIVPVSKALLSELRNSHPLLSKFMKYSEINDKPSWDPVICLPEYFEEIPEWLRPVIDVPRLVDKLLSPFKQILGAFDVVMPDTVGGMIASRMVYI